MQREETSKELEKPEPFYDEELGTYVYIDKDNVKYRYDDALKAWFPVIDDGLIALQQKAYGETILDDEEEIHDHNHEQDQLLEQELQAFLQDAEIVGDKRKRNQQPKDKKKRAKTNNQDPNNQTQNTQGQRKNCSVYVTGLPEDVTIDEVKSYFVKCGIIMDDLKTGQPRIKLYKTEDGKNKGDALITYFKEESVPLAIDLLDDTEFRPGHKIHVDIAQFKPKETTSQPTEPSAESSNGNKDKKKLSKNEKRQLQLQRRKLEKQLEWFDGDEEIRSEKFSRIVILKNMFTLKELDEDPTLLLDLKLDVREECEKLGEVTNVILYDKSPEGAISVRYKEPESALACITLMNGRWFAGRQIVAEIYDGKTKYEKTKTKEDDEEEQRKRMEGFEKWLEHDHD